MRKLKFLKNKKNQRGVALIFALGILGLMVVLGLTFASLSFTEQKISRGASEQEAAKNMAKFAVQRVIAVLENNPSVTDAERIISGNDPNNSNHFDYLWKLITHHGDVPGAGEMKADFEKRIKNGTKSPYWQYILAPNKDGENEIVGRFAYIAYQPVGLLDPYHSARTANEANNPIARYGMSTDEIDLSVLIDVAPQGGSGELTNNDIEALGTQNAASVSDFSNPTALFERFTANTRDKLNLDLNYNALKDRLTSSWFTVPKSPAQPERFLYKDASGVESYIHRFNISRTPEQWADVNVEQLTASKPDDLVAFIDNMTANTADKAENRGVAIPWFKKDDDDTRQIAANFLAYFSPIPTDVTTQKLWGSADSEAKYTANMRTPYINDVLLHLQLGMVVTEDTIGNPVTDVTYQKKFTIVITPKVSVDIELADLYNESLNDIDKLSFKMSLLKELNASGNYTKPQGTDITVPDTNLLTGNDVLKEINLSFTSPKDKKSNTSAVFPVFNPENSDEYKISEIPATKPYEVVITVTMTKPLNDNGTYGDATCNAVEFSEPLNRFVLDNIKLLMSGTINGKNIPLDLANLSLEKTIPVLGAADSDNWKPFLLNINSSGEIADSSQTSQNRHLILRYRAIDSAANLKKEHWVRYAPKYYKDIADFTAEPNYTMPGFNNYAELKADGKLTFTPNEDLDYNTIKVETDEDAPETEFFVDKELDHDSKNAVTGYGAVVSTSFIRGRESGTKGIESPWEIGFIHRGAPYQTLNIKRFNKNSSVIDKYENGDANIFDYVKVVQKESDGAIPAENKAYSGGLVNLQKISRQNETGDKAGNLPAARALFSNIIRGWKMNADGTFSTVGSKTWNSMTEEKQPVNDIVNALADVVDKPDFVLNSRAAILDPSYTELQKALVVGDNDAAKEEVIGRFIMLTSADTTKVNLFTDFLVVTAIAQRIQVVSGSDQLDKTVNDATLIETGYAYRDISGVWKFANAPSSLPAPGSDFKTKFYPGYTRILSTQKVVAWLRKNSNGKWYIERLDYVD